MAKLTDRIVNLIRSAREDWVRVEHLRRIPTGLEVRFSIGKGKRGKKSARWLITCREVYEVQITDLDGGGLVLYPSDHPAARQFTAPRARLSWPRTCDQTKALAALSRAHVKAVDDWIPIDRYLLINTPWNGTSFLPNFAPVAGGKFVIRGPDFLLRAYARALKALGEDVQLSLRAKGKTKSKRLMVLHFGESFVVAEEFDAVRVER